MQVTKLFYIRRNLETSSSLADDGNKQFFLIIVLREKCPCLEFFWSLFFAFGLNTEIYGVNLHIQSKRRKIQTRKTSNKSTFYAVLIIFYKTAQLTGPQIRLWKHIKIFLETLSWLILSSVYLQTWFYSLQFY